VPNLVKIGQTTAEIWRFFDFSKMAAVSPTWIYYARVRTTHEGHLVVFIAVQNLVGMGAVPVVLIIHNIICMFFDFASLA